MHYAIEIVPFGEFGEPQAVMRLAQAAEAAGWEGLFLWDHLAFVFGWSGGDPWVLLSAVAATTSQLKLGVDVTPLPRRRPQVLAHTLVTLDRLSQGRVIFGAGLGGTNEEFSLFGEPDDIRRRAAMLDEGLDLLDSLLRGQTVDHQGSYYTARGVTLTPLPVQKPRPPIWIGGESRAALRRAARWDGWVIPGTNMDGQMEKSPEWLAESVGMIRSQRAARDPFDVAITGVSAAGDSALPLTYAAAGATWWLECLFGLRGSVEDMLRRVEAGPPGQGRL
jgi:alkanesulfonate monooxygenase SsuD/methylene tetrahydromethanopterin reductase-like flavin-dependent oxidoreductase (luciferase family)